MRRIYLVRGLMLGSGLAACHPSPTAPPLGSVSAVPPAVRAADTSAVVSGHPITITPFLWRDFQPIAPTDGRPLVVVVRVAATDGVALAPSVMADSLWVVLGDQAWVAAAVEEQTRPGTGTEFAVVARDGPTWAPGSRVDVVLRLRVGAAAPVYVRAANQVIVRTD
jgi:hypothetical protein